MEERKPYLKVDLVAELAASINISKRKTDILLNELAQIAYREAPYGFNVPGICRLDIVHRKERRARIPSTGEQILIGAHDTLRVRPLRKAKNTVTPRPDGLVQVMETEEPTTDTAAATTPATTPDPTPHQHTPLPTEQQDNPEQLVSFRCPSCSQEIEAPNDMCGTQSECPTCGNGIEVPYISEPGTIWGRALTAAETAAPAAAPDSFQSQSEISSAEMNDMMKGRTIRIELPDDI